MEYMLKRASTYEEIYNSFKWNIPEYYNIADTVCDRWADDAGRIALIYEDRDKQVHRFTYADIRRHANRLANRLRAMGLERGDRVSILLAQQPEAAITHVACWKAGLVSSPASILFGPDAVEYRLNDLGSKVMITDMTNLPKVQEVRGRAPNLQHVLVIDGEGDNARNFWDELENCSDRFENVRTRPTDPAWINYTSGTTGLPKGSVQPHQMMLGHIPGAEFVYDFYPQEGDIIWSPADWAWLAGLMDILMPGWFYGIPVVASAKTAFDPEDAYRLMEQHGVTIGLLTPTMLKMMRQVPNAKERYKLRLRAALSGGEAVGKELLEWANASLGAIVNEGFGQTEGNLVLGNCARVMPVKPGALGRPIPGHVCAIVDDEGTEVAPGTLGNIAVKRPDPVLFLEYLNRPDATREKFAGDWMITGDLGKMDEDGYFWFEGRKDDVITSSGYRIGPGEIEDALLRHPAVALVAVIGVPDPVRTESIKAFIVPAPGYRPGPELEEELRESVKSRLAKHEYPRLFEFVDSLPMTTTGKIMRRELRQREKEKGQSAA